MRRKQWHIVYAFLLITACYHASVDTGLVPNGQTIDRPWAMGFIAGLVPPNEIETAARCPDGVARVETQHSFLNMVVVFITGGILSPMDIRVSCAAKRTSMVPTRVLPRTAPLSIKQAVFAQAIATSKDTGREVYILFTR